MKLQMLFLVLCFAASDSFSQGNQANTNVHHYRNNITIRNFDGTNSTINVNGNSATLINSDGSQSTIDFRRNSSTLITTDGTISSITHNGPSSTVNLADGTQFFVNHMQSTSFCSTEYGKHTITHTFGFVSEVCHKNKIDILIHLDWLIKQRNLEATTEANKEEK